MGGSDIVLTMATQITISLNDAEEAALKAHYQYVDGVTPETFNEIAEQDIRVNYLDGKMTSIIREVEYKKIEAVIQQKEKEVKYKELVKIEELKKIIK